MPGDDDRHRDAERRDRVEGRFPGRPRPGSRPTSTPTDVSASVRQMRGVALERRRVKLAGALSQEGGDAEVGEGGEGDHGDADSEVLDVRAGGQAAGRLVDDHPGADQDQHALDRGSEVLDLLVAVGVLGVGRLVGLADRDQRDHRGHQVDRRVQRLGDDRDRAGDRAGGELERDQHRVGDDRERRRPGLRADHGVSRVGRAAAGSPRWDASSRAARPRWLSACFSSGLSSAIVRGSPAPVSRGTNAGS